ncbi:MAG: hypothetical protein FH758_10840 [Firmicutes bacterium]|nr:hypothetical protein [Bacillota bacterium]
MKLDNLYLEGNEDTLRLKLQSVTIGRDKEIKTIKMQLDTMLEGHSALTIIAGDIGIGKTALIKTAFADLTKLNGTCVYGKYEQYKDEEPYIAIIQIIENIANYMLTLSEEKLTRIRKELNKDLRKDGALIANIAPQTEWIIGKLRKTKVNDYQKLKIRLEKAFQTFITIAAKELYPLIIAIDDLQWADKPSCDVIKSLKDALGEHELHIILAYRNNREEYRTRMKSIINELTNNVHIVKIELADITNKDIRAMLFEIFDDEIDSIDYLAQIIHRKTLGNPLYIKQVIQMLLDSKCIYFHTKHNKWYLKPESFDDFILPIGIEDIINRKIHNLSYEIKEMLEIAACIGSRFDIGLIAEITETQYEYIEEKLGSLCSTGLIVPPPNPSENFQIREYEFAHDRISQIAYEQMNPDRKKRLHFNIAIQQLNQSNRIYVEDNLLSITAHLLNCKSLVLREGEKDRLAIDLYFAGLKAKQSAAVEHALKLLIFCEELLDNSCWQTDYGITLKIKLALAECEFICGRYDDSRMHFEEMLTYAASQEDLAEIKKQYMILNSYIGEYARVLDLGLQALNHLGININMQCLQIQIAKEILYGKFLYRSSRLESIKNAPIINDKGIIDALEILTIMAASASLTDEKLFPLIVLKISNLSAKYGNSLYSPMGYAGYSLILGSVLGDFNKAKKVEEIALSLVDIIDDDALKCTTYFIIGTFIGHWTFPAQQSFNYLQKSFDYGMKSGEFFYGGFTITSMIEMKYSMGAPLKEIEKFLRLHQSYGQKMNHDVLLRLIRIFADHINMLTVPNFSVVDQLIDDKEINRLDTNEMMTYYLLKLQRLYLEGKIDEAYDLSKKTIKQLDSVMGFILQVDFVFYFLLLSLEKKKHQKNHPYRQTKRSFKKYRKKLKIWAEMCPENHKGKHLLIEALFRNLNRRKQEASLYDDAIEHAKENHNLLLEALGNYLAADYYSSNRKIAEVYARDACRLFNQWGSEKTANRIAMLYRIHTDFAEHQIAATGIADEISNYTEPVRKTSFEQRLQDCRKELEVLELETAYQYFLDKVCVESRADSGAILLEKDEQIQLKYMWVNDQKDLRYSADVDMEQIEHLPKKVLRYACRTYEEVIIDTKSAQGQFAGDDYIRSRPGISIICLPLKYKGVFAGLIYLESQNNRGFEAMTVEFVKGFSFYLIAKQALEKGFKKNDNISTNETVNVKLTDREVEVLYYMAAGMSNKKIGQQLGISSSTVKTHTLNLYGKLEVSNRVQAVTKAKTLKLV